MMPTPESASDHFKIQQAMIRNLVHVIPPLLTAQLLPSIHPHEVIVAIASLTEFLQGCITIMPNVIEVAGECEAV